MNPGIQVSARYRGSVIRPRQRGSPPVASWSIFPFGQWRLGILPFRVADSRVASRDIRHISGNSARGAMLGTAISCVMRSRGSGLCLIGESGAGRRWQRHLQGTVAKRCRSALRMPCPAMDRPAVKAYKYEPGRACRDDVQPRSRRQRDAGSPPLRSQSDAPFRPGGPDIRSGRQLGGRHDDTTFAYRETG